MINTHIIVTITRATLKRYHFVSSGNVVVLFKPGMLQVMITVIVKMLENSFYALPVKEIRNISASCSLPHVSP